MSQISIASTIVELGCRWLLICDVQQATQNTQVYPGQYPLQTVNGTIIFCMMSSIEHCLVRQDVRVIKNLTVYNMIFMLTLLDFVVNIYIYIYIYIYISTVLQ